MPEITGFKAAKTYIEKSDWGKEKGMACLFAGEGEVAASLAIQLAERLLPEGSQDFNFHKFDSETAIPSAVAEALGSISLFPGRKVVLVKDPPFLAARTKSTLAWSDFFKLLEAGKTRRAAAFLQNTPLDPDSVAEMDDEQIKKAAHLPDNADPAVIRQFVQANRDLMNRLFQARHGDWSWLESWIRACRNHLETALLVVAEKVDKRSSLFKAFKDHGIVFNLAASNRRGQREQLQALFVAHAKERGLKFSREAAALFLQKVGSDLGALKREMDKLAAMVGTMPQEVSADLVDKLVVVHKTDELYELNEAIGNRDVVSALRTARHLIDQGFHPLAIFQAVTNYLLKLFLLHQALAGIGLNGRSIGSYSRFQNDLLPAIKEYWQEGCPEILRSAHPYGLYKMASKAVSFCTSGEFIDILQSLYHFDLALRSSSTPPELVLETMFLQILKGDALHG